MSETAVSAQALITNPTGLHARPCIKLTKIAKASGGEIYPVERLAEDFVRGVAANKALIVAPSRARLTWWLHRLLPAQVEKVANRLANWARREAENLERAAGIT